MPLTMQITQTTVAGLVALLSGYDRGATQFEDGRVFVTGGFSGFAEFGGEGLMSEGGYDLVVLALAPL